MPREASQFPLVVNHQSKSTFTISSYLDGFSESLNLLHRNAVFQKLSLDSIYAFVDPELFFSSSTDIIFVQLKSFSSANK
jgi:hypothetical protein